MSHPRNTEISIIDYVLESLKFLYSMETMTIDNVLLLSFSSAGLHSNSSKLRPE